MVLQQKSQKKPVPNWKQATHSRDEWVFINCLDLLAIEHPI